MIRNVIIALMFVVALAACKNSPADKEIAEGKEIKAELAPVEVDLQKLSVEEIPSLLKSKKVVLVHVWATWCGPCLKEFPMFAEVANEFQDEGLLFFAINADKLRDEKKVVDFLQKMNIANRNYIFSGRNPIELGKALSDTWNGNLPFTMLVSPKEGVVFERGGEISREELVELLDKNL